MSNREAAVRRLYKDLRITDQLTFYRRRSDEYHRADNQGIIVRNTLLGLAALAGVAGQLLGETGRTVTGVVAAVLAAMATAVTAYETLIGFAPVAKLYDDAALSLEEAELDWDAGTDLAADVDRVEQIFRSEAGQWGQLTIQPPPAP
ncbi:hypothetical protein GCM10010435_69370 [Winogradskya consettensis]|uniref:SMODS and SLOG-associating 2TM effector domain-containing protein n=1 Tax=Winogradskya consettensis TaxID=113560 RepID=A0A919SIQ1_9ACTN|nr:SLATT domain-containing protein [Actinoplanes consettensis]GIM73470.1 hypothetical protein Aco04nite_35410 [Actinoplanes consettensis]